MGIYSKIIDIQKLNMAWDRVRKNKPAPGVDAISCEEFEARKKEELRQLNLELSEHRYMSKPVRLVQIYKEEKMRTISLFCMRDKVVQQSVALELSRLFEPKFSARSYAYRPGMSALQALEQISEKILSGEKLWVLKMDIKDFFDNILHEKMKSILAESIREEDVLELVGTILQAPVMDTRSGEAEANRRGVFQGSGCAPILSNIYLMDYDREMEKRSEFYLRYSDDILVLESDEKKAAELLEFTKIFLEGLGLHLKESKTLLHRLSEQNGFDYLGYRFDENGKSIPGKAETTLQSRLETMWLTSGLTTKEKLKKVQEILGGWEQYYREERTPGYIIEYVALLSMVRNKEEKIREAVESGRFAHRNIYKDVLQYMVDYWKDRARPDNILREYEQFFDVPEETGGKAEEAEKPRSELLEFYQKLLLAPDRELYVNMMQLYTDMGCYNKAAHFWELMSREEETPAAPVLTDTSKEVSEENFKDVNVHTYFGTFVGREDVYVREVLSGDGKRVSEPVLEPLTEELVRRHLTGKEILGTYIQRQNATAKYLVIDVDISKKMLLQYAYDSEEFHACKKKAADTAQEIRKILKHLGLKTYLEDTGFRGYHVWLFFEEWIPMRYINLLSDYVQQSQSGEEDSVTLEFFPNQARIRAGKFGQYIKLPLGVHIRSAGRSFFLDEQMSPIENYQEFLSGITKYTLGAIRKILAAQTADSTQKTQTISRKVDENLGAFGQIPEPIRIVLERCSLMRYLCQKARTTGYLSHLERQSVLYVFGHMGEEGKEFVHAVMGFTLNYQYYVTQKFIVKMPEKPISCVKLREQYKLITAEYGCSCNFKRTKNCYPSPVLHALRNSEAEQLEITVPIGRSVSKSREEKVYEEINIHKQAEKPTRRMVELKRQKRGIDKSIRKLEEEMQRLFDNAGIDCLEVEMGMLVRRKKEQGYEWLIEI